MVSKVVTTIYIDEHLKNLAKIKGINISKVTEEALTFHLNVDKGAEELREKEERLKQELEIIKSTLKQYEKIETPEYLELVENTTKKLAKLSETHPDWRKFLQANCDLIFNQTGISITAMVLEQEVLKEILERKK